MPQQPPDIDYPDSDGQPIGETPRRVRVIIDTYQSLDLRYADRNDVFVAANMFVRSEEHTSELQSQSNLVCRLLLEKKKPHTILAAHRHYALADLTAALVLPAQS